MSAGPSLHLSWDELACHDGTEYPLFWRSTRAVDLAREFEILRGRVGRPLHVLSGYRTPAWNARVGGARKSQHLEGRALDLAVLDGWTLERFYALVRARAEELDCRIRGVAQYPTFVHIDIRPTSTLVVWRGSRALADVGAGRSLTV